MTAVISLEPGAALRTTEVWAVSQQGWRHLSPLIVSAVGMVQASIHGLAAPAGRVLRR